MRIPVEEVPVEFWRKAAQHLESIRETELAAESKLARIGAEVCPLRRPDVDEVAYYEFEVLLGRRSVKRLVTTLDPAADIRKPWETTSARRAEAKSAAQATGFIIVSAGAHDSPIPHWSLSRAPVSRQLDAAAEEGGQTVASVLKLDALCYAAESESGELASHLGQLPTLVRGLPHDPAGARGAGGSLLAEPRKDVQTDDAAEGGEHRVERENGEPVALEPVDAQSWKEFKEAYGEVFAPFLADLRRRAARAWEIDEAATKFGEGVVAGEPYRIALLQSEAAAELSGEAVDLVEVVALDRPGGPPALEVRSPKVSLERELEFEVAIAYAGGLAERLRFFLVSRDVPSNKRSPEDESGEGGGR